MRIKPFQNEPLLDFTNPKNISKQKEALKAVRKKLGKTYELIINGKKIKTDQTFNSYNPSDKDEVIATFYKGTKELANFAVESANKVFQTWKYTSPSERANYLFKAAAIARKKRFEINAYMILEIGKNFAEADADT